MHTYDGAFDDAGDWQQPVPRRLAVSLLISTVAVLSFLSVLKMPDWQLSTLSRVLVLELLPQVVDEPDVEPIEPLPVPQDHSRSGALASAEVADPVEAETPAVPVDWYALAAEVAAEMNAQEVPTYSVNPGYEKRRQAAIAWNDGVPQTRKRQIWDNTEIDQTGRTLLVSGDCHRVLDDPNVTRYEWQKEFFQYIVTCTKTTNSESRRKFQAILDRYVRRAAE